MQMGTLGTNEWYTLQKQLYKDPLNISTVLLNIM